VPSCAGSGGRAGSAGGPAGARAVGWSIVSTLLAAALMALACSRPAGRVSARVGSADWPSLHRSTASACTCAVPLTSVLSSPVSRTTLAACACTLAACSCSVFARLFHIALAACRFTRRTAQRLRALL